MCSKNVSTSRVLVSRNAGWYPPILHRCTGNDFSVKKSGCESGEEAMPLLGSLVRCLASTASVVGTLMIPASQPQKSKLLASTIYSDAEGMSFGASIPIRTDLLSG